MWCCGSTGKVAGCSKILFNTNSCDETFQTRQQFGGRDTRTLNALLSSQKPTLCLRGHGRRGGYNEPPMNLPELEKSLRPSHTVATKCLNLNPVSGILCGKIQSRCRGVSNLSRLHSVASNLPVLSTSGASF